MPDYQIGRVDARPMGPTPFKGPMTTDQKITDLILKENDNETFLNCLQKTEKKCNQLKETRTLHERLHRENTV